MYFIQESCFSAAQSAAPPLPSFQFIQKTQGRDFMKLSCNSCVLYCRWHVQQLEVEHAVWWVPLRSLPIGVWKAALGSRARVEHRKLLQMAEISVVMLEGRMLCVSKEIETSAVVISPALEKGTKNPDKPLTPQNTNGTLVATVFEFLML